MLTAFFARVKPVSTMANPACIHITRKAVISVHTVSKSIDLLSSAACTSCTVSGLAVGEAVSAPAAAVGQATRTTTNTVNAQITFLVQMAILATSTNGRIGE